MPLLQELKKRKVFRVAVVYAVVAWLLAQVAATAFPVLLLPEWLLRAFFVFLILGFPIALVLAWSYELMPEGIVRESSRAAPASVSYGRSNFLIGAATLGLGLLIGGLISGGGIDVEMPSDSVTGPVNVKLPLSLTGYMHSAHPEDSRTLTFSRDGQHIAYIGFHEGERHVFVKDADSPTARVLPNTANAITPFFSPDNAWVGFFADNALQRVPVSGGTAIPVAAMPFDSMGAVWLDDGTMVFTAGYRSGLMRVHENGGDIEPVTLLDDTTTSHRYPEVLPGGASILYQSGLTRPTIMLHDIESGESRFVIDGGFPAYADGILFFLQRTTSNVSLWGVEFDPQSGKLKGDPAPLVGNIAPGYDVSRSGQLVYALPRQVRNRRLIVINEDGSERVIYRGDRMLSPRFSPDGRTIAVTIVSDDQSNIWLLDSLAERAPIQLTRNGGDWPAWSTDGNRLAYHSPGSGIVVQDRSSSEPGETVVQFSDFCYPLQWTNEGLLYFVVNPESQGDIFFRPNDGETIDVEIDNIASTSGWLDPSAKNILVSRWESGRPGIFLKSFPEDGPRRRISVGAGDFPKMTADGSRLLYVAHNRILSVDVSSDDELIFGDPELVYEFGGGSTITYDPFHVSPDGSKIAIIDTDYEEGSQVIYLGDWRSALFTDD